MTELHASINLPSALFRNRAGMCRMIKHNPKTDMTPMVDLGFLLIAFFVVTAELSKPRGMNLYMPHDGATTSSPGSRAITFLTAANNKLFYYFGPEEDAVKSGAVFQSSWDEKTGIGIVIRRKQLQLDQVARGRKEMIGLIKPGRESTYKNVVDVLDEMTINLVTRYAIVRPGEWDRKYLEKNR